MSDIREIYRLYFKDVYKYLLAISHDSHVAEELTQETFFRALQKIDSFRGECELRVWLCQIAKNLFLNLQKKNKKHTSLNASEEQESPGGDLLQSLADKESAMKIYRVLHRLAEPYKEVFTLRVFGELSFSLIAGLFGKSDSWARVTYHRACKKIREELDNENKL